MAIHFVTKFQLALILSALVSMLVACDRVDNKVLPCDPKVIIHNDEFTTELNQPVSLPIHANDTVNCAQQLDVRNPAFGNISMQGHAIIYTPPTDFTGKDSLTYAITSGQITYEALVRIWVLHPCSPKINPDSVSTTINARINIAPAANDTFCEGTTMSVAFAPAHGQLVALPDNQVQYVPVHGFTGTDYFVYKMCFENTCAETRVTVFVHDMHACQSTFLPQDDQLQATAGLPVEKSLAELLSNDGGCEQDLDMQSFTLVSMPEKGTATVSNGVFRYTPITAATGTDQVLYRVCRISRPGHCEEANIIIQIE